MPPSRRSSLVATAAAVSLLLALAAHDLPGAAAYCGPDFECYCNKLQLPRAWQPSAASQANFTCYGNSNVVAAGDNNPSNTAFGKCLTTGEDVSVFCQKNGGSGVDASWEWSKPCPCM